MIRPAAVIVAAGSSLRLGEPKQLVVVAGERLLERAVRVAVEAGCSPVVVVLGQDAERVASQCALGSARVVVNHAWSEGMAASVRCGIAAIEETAEAVILMVCDQPSVTPPHLRQLADRCGDGPVASYYAGRCGVPACFPRSCFAALLALQGDAGAHELLGSAQSVELPGGELDVDTRAKLAKAREIYEGSAGRG